MRFWCCPRKKDKVTPVEMYVANPSSVLASSSVAGQANITRVGGEEFGRSATSIDELDVLEERLPSPRVRYNTYLDKLRAVSFKMPREYDQLNSAMQFAFQSIIRLWPQFRMCSEVLIRYLLVVQANEVESAKAEVFASEIGENYSARKAVMENWMSTAKTTGAANLAFLFYLIEDLAKGHEYRFLGVLAHLERFAAVCNVNLEIPGYNFFEKMMGYFMRHPEIKIAEEREFLLAVYERLGSFLFKQAGLKVHRSSSAMSASTTPSPVDSVADFSFFNPYNPRALLGQLMLTYPGLLNAHIKMVFENLNLANRNFDISLGDRAEITLEELALKCAVVYLYTTSGEDAATIIMEELGARGVDFFKTQEYLDCFSLGGFKVLDIKRLITRIQEHRFLSFPNAAVTQ